MGASVLAALLVVTMPSRADEASEKLYKAKCAACHGADGKGETATGKALKVKDFASEEVQKMSDEDLNEVIAKGKNKMPAYGKKFEARRDQSSRRVRARLPEEGLIMRTPPAAPA